MKEIIRECFFSLSTWLNHRFTNSDRILLNNNTTLHQRTMSTNQVFYSIPSTAASSHLSLNEHQFQTSDNELLGNCGCSSSSSIDSNHHLANAQEIFLLPSVIDGSLLRKSKTIYAFDWESHTLKHFDPLLQFCKNSLPRISSRPYANSR